MKELFIWYKEGKSSKTIKQIILDEKIQKISHKALI